MGYLGMSWKTFVGSVGEMALLVGEIGVGEVALTTFTFVPSLTQLVCISHD